MAVFVVAAAQLHRHLLIPFGSTDVHHAQGAGLPASRWPAANGVKAGGIAQRGVG
jgi:hypothetical protein